MRDERGRGDRFDLCVSPSMVEVCSELEGPDCSSIHRRLHPARKPREMQLPSRCVCQCH